MTDLALQQSVVAATPRSKTFAAVVVIAYALIATLPIVWIILTSFKTQDDAIAYPPVVMFQPSMEGYVNLFTIRSRQTPEFIEETRRNRLERDFGGAYRYLEILFGGNNPYIEGIDRNVEFLRQVLRSENWHLLRRRPPIFAAVEDPMGTMRGLMLGYIKRVWANY